MGASRDNRIFVRPSANECTLYRNNPYRMPACRLQFVWEKFTDSVVVDDDGKIVNQFPGYPMRGAYRIDEQMVYMDSASGEPMENMYLHRHDDRYYLLTAEQFEAWEKTGEYAECALMLGGRPDD